MLLFFYCWVVALCVCAQPARKSTSSVLVSPNQVLVPEDADSAKAIYAELGQKRGTEYAHTPRP